MKNTCIKHCLGIMALLLFFAACRKDESDNGLQVQQALQVQKFLTLPPDADAGLVRIAAKLSELNNSKSVIPGLADKYGYPEWEYALHAEKGTAVNKYIPLVNNNNKTVEAVIQCILKDGSVYLGLITRNNIKDIIKRLPDTPDKPDELTFRALFWEFGNQIYGHPLTWIVIMDNDGNILREYPATEEQKNSRIMTKAMNCHWVGIGGGDMYDEHGNYVGGGTDIRWEWRCKWVADDTVDWDASPEEGVIWDDPGSGGGPQLEPQPDEPKNPCENANKMQQDAKAKERLKDLANSTGSLYEVGVVINANDQHRTTVGNLGEKNVNVEVPWSNIRFFAHTHYEAYPSDMYTSIFSAADIKILYNLYKEGKMNKVDEFEFALVTPTTSYILMIENESDFAAFGKGFAKGSNSWNEYTGEIQIGNLASQNETNFLDFIIKKNTGLKLYKANSYANKNTGTFDSWSARELNSAGTTPVNTNCQ